MLRKTIFDFNFPYSKAPLIEMSVNSTGEGEIVLDNLDLEEVSSLAGTVFELTPPSSASDDWTKTGSNVSSGTVLDLSYRKLSTGKIVLKYKFDPSAIAEVSDGDFYGLTIKVNAGDDATTEQAGIEIIFKIKDRIVS